MFKQLVQKIIGHAGYEVIPIKNGLPKDMDENFRNIYLKCKPFTLTTLERMYALYKATQYVIEAKIPGDFVECGVWKGGSAMLMAYTLQNAGINNQNIYLYDTYAGMSTPTKKDVTSGSRSPAKNFWLKSQKSDHNDWCYASLAEVKHNMAMTNYPQRYVTYLKGKVENTIPKTLPKKVSLLRLDTDWYESTKHELNHLYPLLSPGGVLIIDDYGAWEGAKMAVDEYFPKSTILLNRIDFTGRVGVKT